jgi:predicted TIM-barrel fold metal-dependent hydrolase
VSNADGVDAGTSGGSRDRVTVVSADTHVGPSMPQLREYCPKDLLGEFDAFVESLPEDRIGSSLASMLDPPEIAAYRWNARALGHNDVHSRLKDMDRDGVACEVVFHSSANGEPLPFAHRLALRDRLTKRGAALDASAAALEMEGIKIYNRWLADFCSVEPERHAGLCHVPMSDMEASIAEVTWGHEHGLKGVNFPAPTSALPPYDDPIWDRFFTVCAERDMVLDTHIGGGEQSLYSGFKPPAFSPVFMMEDPWLGRRGIWQLIFAGAFDRHPKLKLVLTELPGSWWDLTVRDMDAIYVNPMTRRVREYIKKKPSEYMASNVFMGASFQSRQEAEMAVVYGFDSRFMWGSDYPHPEGTWLYTENPDDPSLTRLSLANTFHDLPESPVRRMIGQNAIGCYGLDAGKLAKVAERIGPDMDELRGEPDLASVPDNYRGSGFRSIGAFG